MGCVYVAFDTTKPDRCKIGYSSREAKARIAEASNPDYKLFGHVKSPHAKAIERLVHKIMEAAGIRRILHTSGGRSEWFSFSAIEALRVVKCVTHVAAAIPLKPLLPGLCRSLVLEGLTPQAFLEAQGRIVRASHRRNRTLYYVRQMVGERARERYHLNVWLNAASEQSLRNELAALLQKYRKQVPAQKRSEWHALQELLPVDEESRQREAEEQKRSERVGEILRWSEPIWALSRDKQLEKSMAHLNQLWIEKGSLDKDVQDYAEKMWSWVQTQFRDILFQLEKEATERARRHAAAETERAERHAAAEIEKNRQTEQRTQFDKLKRENMELADALTPWVEMTCKQLGLPENLIWQHSPLQFSDALDDLAQKLQSVETPEKLIQCTSEFIELWQSFPRL